MSLCLLCSSNGETLGTKTPPRQVKCCLASLKLLSPSPAFSLFSSPTASFHFGYTPAPSVHSRYTPAGGGVRLCCSSLKRGGSEQWFARSTWPPEILD